MRRMNRLAKRLIVRYSTGSGALPRSGCTLDLSEGGLFLGSRAQLPPGTPILARIELPDGGRTEVHAIVAWSRPTPRGLNDPARGGMGLRLVWAERSYFELLGSCAQVG
jgi:Tfp pilus assembly protein PilZ